TGDAVASSGPPAVGRAVDALAVVGDLDHHTSTLIAHVDLNGGGTRVPQDVGQRLLDDAVGDQVDPRCQWASAAGQGDGGGQARLVDRLHQHVELGQARGGRLRL